MQSRHIEDWRSDADQQDQEANVSRKPVVAQKPLGDLRGGKAGKRGEGR